MERENVFFNVYCRLGVVHNTILMSKPHLQEQPQANVYAYNLAFLTDGLYRDGTGQMSGV